MNEKKTLQNPGKQLKMFKTDLPPIYDPSGPEVPCRIFAAEKRRDGGTRYWCQTHRADATAKYGKPATTCIAADTQPISSDEILSLDLNKYKGGVALWGAVPAVYDTTRLPMDRGIHVHARVTPDAEKELDWTHRAVRLFGCDLPEDGVQIDEIDAIYYMVSSVFGFEMSYIKCTHCGWPHLDKDWFSVHPHRRHLCAGCGRHFHDRTTGVGNPIVGIRDACDFKKHEVQPAARTLEIQQSQYLGGIQIWGSNPALLWTGDTIEEEGIHVHAFLKDSEEPDLDDTFREVTIDGIQLDPNMVRVLMAQSVMPSLEGRVQPLSCNACDHSQFDAGAAAYTPSNMHTCSGCGVQFRTTGRKRNVVANPLPAILNDLAKFASRAPQQHRLELRPETL
ncbi:hypothetical protein [uncultured Rubinisphaera sp.]|uniref:hypothetical protein n=1 Tax=uncultured Rubinisphaera sp. TaxID=1678686 RepID=UPI0030DA143F